MTDTVEITRDAPLSASLQALTETYPDAPAAELRRFADARLLATEQLKRDDRFPALRLNVNSEIVADVLINQSNHPLAARFLRD